MSPSFLLVHLALTDRTPQAHAGPDGKGAQKAPSARRLAWHMILLSNVPSDLCWVTIRRTDHENDENDEFLRSTCR